MKGKDFKGNVKGKYVKNDGGKSKRKDKGKSKDYGKHGKGAGAGRGKGPLPADVCKLCGGKGHWSRECPVRTLRQVQDEASSTTATQSMTGSGGTGLQAAQGSPQATTVRRIIKVNLDDLDEQMDEPEVTMLRMVQVGETYDLTYSDSDDDWFVWWKRLFHGLCQQLHERRCGALWHRWFEAAGW